MLVSALRLYEWYVSTLEFADPRSTSWPLMSSPTPTLAIILTYLLAVLILPRLITRPLLTARWPMVGYNTSMCLLNAYIFGELCINMYSAGYNAFCQPVSRDEEGAEYRIACALYWYFLSKVFELADTAFFIARCKSSQLTFLHVYHHSSMLALWWIAAPCAALNSFIHIVMYYYYARTAAWPESKVWWKKYLTSMQLIQFCTAITLGIGGLLMDCKFPRWMGYFLVGYMISFVVLFGQFYARVYMRKSLSSPTSRQSVPVSDMTKNGVRRRDVNRVTD